MTGPWNDAAGRFSPLKALVLAALCLPAALAIWHFADGTYTARPFDAFIRSIGGWTMWLLVVTLAFSPVQAILRIPALGALRRITGVATFCYVALHVAGFAADQMFDLRVIATEIVSRIYLTIGMVAVLILLALAVTSTDGMTRRLGGRRWRGLHRLVYVAAPLGAIHFFMQSKADVREPTIVAGLLLLLAFWRLLRRLDRRRVADPYALAALGLVAAALTLGGEVLYFHLRYGVDPLRVVMAAFDVELGLRPAWVVLGAGAACAVAALLRQKGRLPAAAG